VAGAEGRRGCHDGGVTLFAADEPDAHGRVDATVLVRPALAADVPDGRYVSALTVDPARRRAGVGSRLLADLLAAPGGGPVRSVVNARNAASLALHAAHGFHEVARAATWARIEFEGGTGVLLEHGEDQA
jgi:L-amino acid N-acyltransferase YncA